PRRQRRLLLRRPGPGQGHRKKLPPLRRAQGCAQAAKDVRHRIGLRRRDLRDQTGSLRLILGRSEALWVVGQKKKKLLVVPVAATLGMIYQDLGVYAGERFGTPCDDF